MSSLILRWLHKLYALQRVLHYRVNLYANERLGWHRSALPRLVSPDIFRRVFHLRAGGPRAFASLRCVAYNDLV